MIKTYKLSNGIRVVAEKMHGLKSVAFGVFVKTGSAYENTDNNGIAHMIEHMMFKGTTNYSAKELADMMTMIGGNLNAYTAKECTSYYCRTLDTQLEMAITIIADMIKNSKFDPKDISKEKRVILDEIDMYNDSPEDLVHELLQKKVWNGNPLGYIISGNKKNVKSFKQKELLQFVEDNYFADNIIISVAGSFEENYVLELLEQNYGDIKNKAVCNRKSAPKYNRCFVKKHKDIEQAHINLAFNGVGYDNDKRYTLSIINSILGGSLNSRLFQHIREELGITYSIYSYESQYKNAGLFHIYAAMNPNQLKYVLSETKECVKILVDGGIDDDELDNTKRQLITEYILGMESTSFRMENNARSLIMYGQEETLDDVTEKISDISKDDVKFYLEEYLDVNNASLCVVGNMNELDINSLDDI